LVDKILQLHSSLAWDGQRPRIELSDGVEDVEHIRLVRVQSRKADHVQLDRLFLVAATLW